MVDAPASGAISSNLLTKDGRKAYHEQCRDFVVQLPGANVLSALVIASGKATPTQCHHTIDTEGGTGLDELTNLLVDSLPDGSLIHIIPASVTRLIRVKHSMGGVGQIETMDGEDVTLNNLAGGMLLRRTGNTWKESLRGVSKSQLGTTAIRTIEGVSPNTSNNLDLAVSGAMSFSTGTNQITLNETHSSLTNNPHSVTATQVGKDTAQWNLDKIASKTLDTASRADRKFPVFRAGPNAYIHELGPGGGPNNWAIVDGTKGPAVVIPPIIKQSGGIFVSYNTGSIGNGGPGPATYKVDWPSPYSDAHYPVSIGWKRGAQMDDDGYPVLIFPIVIQQTTASIWFFFRAFRQNSAANVTVNFGFGVPDKFTINAYNK